jgi:aspartate aminotransferase-like enzyme
MCNKKRSKKMGQKTRNFGSGTRDMKSAGEVFAERSTESFSSAATLSSRFSQFVDFAKENGIKKLENVTKETVEKYAKNLKESGLAAATQQNYLSAVNVVMQEARGDQEVRVTGREAGLEQRSGVATEYKGKVERQELSDRTQTIVDCKRPTVPYLI